MLRACRVGQERLLGLEQNTGEERCQKHSRHTLPLSPSLGSEQSTRAGRCQRHNRGTHFTSAHRWAQSRAPGRGGARVTAEAHTSPQPIAGLRAEHRGGEVPEAQQRHTLHLGPPQANWASGWGARMLMCVQVCECASIHECESECV